MYIRDESGLWNSRACSFWAILAYLTTELTSYIPLTSCHGPVGAAMCFFSSSLLVSFFPPVLVKLWKFKSKRSHVSFSLFQTYWVHCTVSSECIGTWYYIQDIFLNFLGSICIYIELTTLCGYTTNNLCMLLLRQSFKNNFVTCHTYATILLFKYHIGFSSHDWRNLIFTLSRIFKKNLNLLNFCIILKVKYAPYTCHIGIY